MASRRRAGTEGSSGRRDIAGGSKGRLISTRAPRGAPTSIAVSETVIASAARRALDAATGVPARAALIEPGDIREGVHVRRAGCLLVLAVDASGSMGARSRMEAARGAVLSLLLDAYQQRDRVAMVAFGGEGARVLMQPTGSIEVARARLGDLPTGGRTPLAAGIEQALEVATRRRGVDSRPLIALVTDGRATEAAPGIDPVEAAIAAAESVRRAGVESLVLDAESGVTRLGLSRDLAEAMGARYVVLDTVDAESLTGVLRSERALVR